MNKTIKRLWAKLLSVVGVRRAGAGAGEQPAQDAQAEAAELLRLAEEENQELHAKLAEKDRETAALLEDADAEIKRDQTEIQRLRGLLYHAQQYNQILVEKGAGQREPDIPDSLTGLKEWAEDNLAGAVELHGRALRGAKESQYKDERLIYETLLLLRDYYVPMRRGSDPGLREQFEQRCQALGVELERSGRKLRLKEQGNDYCIDVGGKPRLLDWHFKKGSGRAPRDCFRLYFLWDADNALVVVGWLPSHLKTRAS